MSQALTKVQKELMAFESMHSFGGPFSKQPTSEEQCETLLRANGRMAQIDNVVQYKLMMKFREVLFYRAWSFCRKTYIVDPDFFASLQRSEKVHIYPSVLQTIPFHTFALELTLPEFQGLCFCNFNTNKVGVFCSFLLCKPGFDDEVKQFNVHIPYSKMFVDENGDPYFELNAQTNDDVEHAYTKKELSFDHNLADLVDQVQNHPEFSSLIHMGDKSEISSIEMDFCNKNPIHLEEDFLWKRALIQFAYYLCTPEPDLQETGASYKNARRCEKLKKPIEERIYTAGSRMGQRIRIGKSVVQDTADAIHVDYAKGTPKCPHVRAAHWTHIWCGPKGAQHLEPRFIEVSFVNYNLGNLAECCNEISDKVKQSWAGESRVGDILKSLDLPFVTQKSVVINEHRYRYDYAIQVNQTECYIEYDGAQHFGPVSVFGGQDGYERTHSADISKNNYCTDCKIPLLRIPYWRESEMVNMIRDFVANPVVRSDWSEYYQSNSFV